MTEKKSDKDRGTGRKETESTQTHMRQREKTYVKGKNPTHVTKSRERKSTKTEGQIYRHTGTNRQSPE